MSLFAYPFFQTPTVTATSSSLHPIFRLFEDVDSYSRCSQAASTGNGRHRMRACHAKSFTPRFDVKETDQGYELHGDLPGIDQKDIEVEFTDENVLTIRGRTERHTSQGPVDPAAAESTETSAATTIKSPEVSAQTTSTVEQAAKSPQAATVEDDADDFVSVSNAASDEMPAPSEAAVTQSTTANTAAPAVSASPSSRYWLSERSVGQFSRSFSFPTRVDQEAVEASMRNGVLRIHVPKAKKVESRRIVIA